LAALGGARHAEAARKLRAWPKERRGDGKVEAWPEAWAGSWEARWRRFWLADRPLGLDHVRGLPLKRRAPGSRRIRARSPQPILMPVEPAEPQHGQSPPRSGWRGARREGALRGTCTPRGRLRRLGSATVTSLTAADSRPSTSVEAVGFANSSMTSRPREGAAREGFRPRLFLQTGQFSRAGRVCPTYGPSRPARVHGHPGRFR
jgi:hypothetical protein